MPSDNNGNNSENNRETRVRRKDGRCPHSYNVNRSTIGTMLKNKDKIMEHVKSAVPMMLTIISKKQSKVIKEVKKLLSVWMQAQHQC